MRRRRSDLTWIRQHEEDKKRKREEKEATKRLRQQQEYRNEEKAKEYERTRRMSFNVASPPVDFPPQNATQSAGYSGVLTSIMLNPPPLFMVPPTDESANIAISVITTV